MTRRTLTCFLLILLMIPTTNAEEPASPFLTVLGISQDGGTPQAGTREHRGWSDPARKRMATSLAVVDPTTSRRWIFEATPDFREQLYRLDQIAPVSDTPGIDGIFVTHAHMGHYVGLMHLGHEAMGARGIKLWAMPRMAEYLSSNGPWDQLVRYQNVDLVRLADEVPVQLSPELAVTPFLVPHRQEYSEVVGFQISGPRRTVLFIPDIDSWEEWDELGTRIEDRIESVDLAYLDGSFFANGEIPGRDMSGFPHPFISHSMKRFESLPAKEKAKVRFIHLNHTNAAIWPESPQRKAVVEAGFSIAEEGERVDL